MATRNRRRSSRRLAARPPRQRSVGPVLLLFLVLVGFGVLLEKSRERILDPGVRESELALRLPYPLLLIHGLGGTAEEWREAGLLGYMEMRGLRPAGVLRSRSGKVEQEAGPYPAELGEVFTIGITDPDQGLERWSVQIGDAVRWIRRRTGAPRLTLVGFSTGGLAARKYLVENPTDHHVARLVTVATPHRGSELALAARLKRDLEGESAAESRVMVRVARELIAALEESTGRTVDAPLISELAPEAWNPFLKALNRAEHPRDVEYACLVVTGLPWKLDWSKAQAAAARLRAGRFRTPALSRLGNALLNAGALLENGERPGQGDGVVRADSQDLSKVDFFKTHPKLIRSVRNAAGVHWEAESRFGDIFELALGGLEISQARIAGRDGGKPFLVVDFDSPVVGLVEGTIRGPAGRPVPISDLVVMRSGDRAFGRLRTGPLPTPPPSPLTLYLESPAESQTRGRSIHLSKPCDSHNLAPPQREAEDTTLTLLRVDHLPWNRPDGGPWDPFGGRPDLRIRWLVDGEERGRSRVYDDVGERLRIDESIRMVADPSRSRIGLELWDVDLAGLSEVMDRIVWNPGELPWGSSQARSETGITVDVRLEAHVSDSVIWNPVPLCVDSGLTDGSSPSDD